MSTHYYLGWFNNFFMKELIELLNQDITDRKSLVMISASLSKDENVGAIERSWLDQSGILFEEYHLIDFNITKDIARKLIQNASVIFLLGGNTVEQNNLLAEYELSEKIRASNAVIIGTSAGAINMSSKWLHSNNDGVSTIYHGVGLDDFSVLSHYDLENCIENIQSKLAPLLNDTKVYASNKDCAVRVKKGKVDILGDVYLVSQSMVEKLNVTL